MYNSNKQPWVNRYIKQLRKHKKKCYKAAKANSSSLEWLHYKSLKKDIQQECRKAYGGSIIVQSINFRSLT